MSVSNGVMEDKARSDSEDLPLTTLVSSRPVSSPPCLIRNLNWKILVKPRHRKTQNQEPHLGFHLVCIGDSVGSSWPCSAVAEFRLLSVRPEVETFSKKCQHIFTKVERFLGYPTYMNWNDVLDPVKGYIKDDSITLQVHVTTEEPHITRSNKKNTEFEDDDVSESTNESDEENDENKDKEEESESNTELSNKIKSDCTKENDKNEDREEESERNTELSNKNKTDSTSENNKNKDKEEEPGNTAKIENNLTNENVIQQPKNPSDGITDCNEKNEKLNDEKEELETNDKWTNSKIQGSNDEINGVSNKNDVEDSVNDIKKQSEQLPDKDTKTDNGTGEKSENNQKLTNRREINLLLLSETGVGKSTFINSIANYVTYGSFEIAEKEKLLVLIPAKFQIEDKSGKRHYVSIGESDKNELLNQGESATQDVKSYIFPIGKNEPNIRLIDTPGMGDTRGPDQDLKNCDYILNYIGNFRELHGICCLFKPLNSRNTVYFQYCISEILSRLDRSASKNIMFVFTNTRGANYSSGETYEILKKTLDDIRRRTNVEIPLDKNIFCFDNEAFRYMAATQKNLKLSADYKKKSKESWTRARKEFWRMMKYIKKIEPHLVQSTSAVNEARRMVNQLAQPLADISELIHGNIDALQKHQEKLDNENMSMEDLRKQMFMPVIDLQVEPLDKPTTVCTTKKCSEIYKVGDKNKWHYKQRCHESCTRPNVQADIVGCPALMNCFAMDRQTNLCRMCGCSYRVHMHVYYMTTTVEHRIKNSNALKNIDDKEKCLEKVNELIATMVVRKTELEKEHDIIVTSCAKFTHFLQNNAITPFNDSYKDYIKYLITREQTLGPNMSNRGYVVHLSNLLQKYEEAKKLFDNSLKMSKESGTVSGVTSKEIVETVEKLYELKHSGKKIKELYESQQMARKREHEHTEYIHSSGPRTYRNNKTKFNKGNREGGFNNDVEEQYRTAFKEDLLYGILKDFFSYVSDNRESIMQNILEDFFAYVSWRTSKQKGKGPQDVQNRSTQNRRNVTKNHSAGLPGSTGDFHFGNNRSFFNSQPTSAFVPSSPEQHCENANASAGNNGFLKLLLDSYNFSSNHCNAPVDEPLALQQFIDMYINSTATTNSNQYKDSVLQNTNNCLNLNDHMPNFESRYHQQNPPPGRCFDQMANHSATQRYNDNNTSFSTYYAQHSDQQNAYQPSYFNNERQHTYPQKDSGYRKVTGFSDQYNTSTDHYQASNFNNFRQQNYSHSGESDYGKGSLSSNPYDSLKEYHQESQHNYPNREDQNYHGTLNFNRRQHTFPANHSDFSQREMTESSNQNNISRDHQQTSQVSQVKKFFSSMRLFNFQ